MDQIRSKTRWCRSSLQGWLQSVAGVVAALKPALLLQGIWSSRNRKNGNALQRLPSGSLGSRRTAALEKAVHFGPRVNMVQHTTQEYLSSLDSWALLPQSQQEPGTPALKAINPHPELSQFRTLYTVHQLHLVVLQDLIACL